MPQISSIEPQKKIKNRFNVFIDGNFAFGIDENTLVKNNLRINQVLSQSEIEKIIKDNSLAKLQDAGLRFLSYRQRSEKEVRDYLINKIAKDENIKYSQAKDSPLVELALSKFRKYNYINDLEFAKWWVSSRTRTRPKGHQVIRLELQRKGIDKDTIEAVLNKSPNQKVLAKKAIEKKIARWQKLPPVELKKKVYRYLVSRGFDFETIKETFAHFAKKQ